MALTSEDIVTAAEELRKRGQTPTLRAIREQLGTGSLGTISRLLREGPPGGAPPQDALPPVLLRALRDALEEREKEARKTLLLEREADREQLKTLEEENARLEERIGLLTEIQARLSDASRKGEGRLDEIRSTCEALRSALERESAERLKAEKRASELEGERHATQERLQELKEGQAEAQNRIQELIQEKATALGLVQALREQRGV